MSRRILGDEFYSFKVQDGTAEPGSPWSSNEELQVLAEYGALDDIYRDIVSPTYLASSEDNKIATFFNEISQDSQLIIKPDEEKPYAFPSACLKILRRCRSRVVGLNGGNVQLESPSTLSANDIIELAASFFVQSNSKNEHQLSALIKPYATSYDKDIQLVQYLFLCAEKVSNQDYDSASKILEECHKLSLSRENVVHRLVYYFTEALCDKIECENGRSFRKGMIDSWPLEVSMAPSSSLAAFHEKIPFNQITQSTSIQLMDDHVAGCKRSILSDDCWNFHADKNRNEMPFHPRSMLFLFIFIVQELHKGHYLITNLARAMDIWFSSVSKILNLDKYSLQKSIL